MTRTSTTNSTPSASGSPSTPSTVQTVEIRREVEIAASVEAVWAATLDENGPGGQQYDGSAFPRVLEAWPGGRWFRDLGNNAGHLWGHVQVIKPPTLLEITGPMFMSYPAVNFIRYRIAAEGAKTRLSLLHQAMGLIPADHASGVVKGWEFIIKRIGERAATGNVVTQRGV